MVDYDVIVVGGGVSGAVAGIASARVGAKTLIVEKMAFLGGALTACGVGPMMTFHAGDLQVVRGIAEEVVVRLKEMGGSHGHIIDSTGYTYTVTPFDAEMMKYVLEKMFLQAGGDILYHSVISRVGWQGKNISAIAVQTKGGEKRLRAKVYIDATGDADLAALSGVKFQLGRPQDELCQPVTMNFKLSHVDIAEIKSYIRTNPDDCPHVKIALMDKAERLSMGGFCRAFQEGQKSGAIDFSRELILLFETNNNNEVIVNTTRIQKVNPTDAWQLSQAESEGRRQVWQLFDLMKKSVPGFSKARLISTGPNLGVRESRKIVGRYTITTDDLFAGKIFEDEIACGGYPVDVHSPDGEGTNSRHLPYGAVYGIPYRALLNEEVQNLVVVGRCISATHEACAAVRVSPIAMAMGQAGGAAAALAAMQGGELAELDYQGLRAEILKEGGFLR